MILLTCGIQKKKMIKMNLYTKVYKMFMRNLRNNHEKKTHGEQYGGSLKN